VTERTLVDYVLRGMKRRWKKPVKHADAYTEGIGDLSAWIWPVGNVFIELKALRQWPKRPETKVSLGLSDAQRDFLEMRRGWLFVRVGKEYLLFDWRAVFCIDVQDKPQTAHMLRSRACQVWKNSVNWKEFEEWISLKP
jgi:hypothetical protein